MNIATHSAVAILCAGLVDAGKANALAACIGAALPDIDSQHSSLGRLFWFISKPIEDQFGHRGVIHSLPLWGFLLILAIFFSLYSKNNLATWLIIGAISHIIIDCYNVSGVRLFTPFTERRFVIFKRDWRIYVNSVQELMFTSLVIAMILASGYMHSLGGWRKGINILARSPQITFEEFTRASNLKCRVEGLFRYANGNQEQINWLCVGLEDKYDLALWNGKRIIRNGDGKFLRNVLKQSKKPWQVINVKGFVTSDVPCFWFDNKHWHFAKPGDLMHGSIKSLSGELPTIIPYELERGDDY